MLGATIIPLKKKNKDMCENNNIKGFLINITSLLN